MLRSLLLLMLGQSIQASLPDYDAFPDSEAPFVSYAVSPPTDNWAGEDFESYTNGEIIECSSDKTAQDHLDVTSGCLKSKYAGNWRRGYTDDRVFRMVTISRDDDDREIKWTDQTISYRAYITEFQDDLPDDPIPDWAGLHVFFRYRTSDDLYVASIRYDGKATIKKKHNGIYTTLAWMNLDDSFLDSNTGKLKTQQWYQLKATADGSTLKFKLDGTEILSATSGTFSWGTTGIRTDYVSTYLDDINMSA